MGRKGIFLSLPILVLSVFSIVSFVTLMYLGFIGSQMAIPTKNTKESRLYFNSVVAEDTLTENINQLLRNLVGKRNYETEVFVTSLKRSEVAFNPSNIGLDPFEYQTPVDLISGVIHPSDIKVVNIRLLINSDALLRRNLDPRMIRSRIERQLHTYITNAQGIRTHTEVYVVPFSNLSPFGNWKSVGGVDTRVVVFAFFIFSTLLLVWQMRRSSGFTEISFPTNEESPVFALDPLVDQTGYDIRHVDWKKHSTEIEKWAAWEIALMCYFMSPSRAARLLESLPIQRQASVVHQCMKIERLEDERRDPLLKAMAKKLAAVDMLPKVRVRNGVKLVTRLLQSLHLAKGKLLLEELRQVDPDSLDQIKNEFFVCESLIPLGEKGIEFLSKAANPIDIFLAVYETDQPTKELLLRNISERERVRVLRSLGSQQITPEKIKRAQIRITKVINMFQRDRVSGTRV